MSIDLTKYEGHEILCSCEWYALRADAKLLLDEVKRLRADLDEAVEAIHVIVEHADLSDDHQYGTLSTSFVRGIFSPVLAKHGDAK